MLTTRIMGPENGAQSIKRGSPSPCLRSEVFDSTGLLPSLEHLFCNALAPEADPGEQDGLSRLLEEIKESSPAPDAPAAELCAFREILLEVARRISIRYNDLQRVRSLILTDDLTGLYNRRGFLFMATQHLKLARRTDQALLLFFMDVDDFKSINDSLGHLRGDAFLISCAHALKHTFRETDILARLGGDEFAVLAHEGADHSCATISQRLETLLETLNRDVPHPQRISFSTGTVRFNPRNPVSLAELLSLADRRMYERKRVRQPGSA